MNTLELPLIALACTLPLVIYAPADVEVRFRIWSAAVSASPAPRQ